MIDRKQDRGPCRHSCRHYDCLMDRGEPLPAHVTAYQNGALYHATSAAIAIAHGEVAASRSDVNDDQDQDQEETDA
jgi:hypothetical protein